MLAQKLQGPRESRATHSAMPGFTIVELLVVIVVIAILAAITVASFNGIISRARNTARLVDLKSYVDAFHLYEAQNAKLPGADSTEVSHYCLGSSFPTGQDGERRCRELGTADPNRSYREADSTAFMADLESGAGSARSGGKWAVEGWLVGPWIEIYPEWNQIRLSTAVESEDPATCTDAGFASTWNDPGGAAMICTMTMDIN
ncbi:prepilin-type N-terminal cleavage/methylation domain-containing protein [Gulosibacter macacae]|uniref:Prepilin-type N-terminal cleavage/methylation domain-containing protein n=1 Tax=Gulosibacter macacae TaxID=2488791 RepID=A0A3P3VTP7_9MICO|nr:prepilin-type N-terminal cleavage/methylation domain-containing protein [Gulosibacter macacae]RRJ85687.1 prepilin-type N-terminal cleavage/methylation domain-containing protein [Gulosibacter macacae]